jgi:gliding motility-associated-like protein
MRYGFLLLILASSLGLNAQSSCTNIDFELGNLSTWTGFTGYAGGAINTPGIVNGRHTIMSTLTYDVQTNNQLPTISPNGGNYSMRLGNSNVNGQAEAIERSFDVTNQENSLLISYAVVFEDHGHDPIEQPRFSMSIRDQNGNVIEGCFNYSVTAASNLPGFHPGLGEVYYRDWTPIAVDLTPYIGQTVTLRLETADCTVGGHFGYAYFDAKCGRMELEVYDCLDDGIRLNVPSGFSSYAWSTGDSTNHVLIENPVVGETIMVEASTESGCSVVFTYTVPEEIISTPLPELTPAFCNIPMAGTFTAPEGFAQYQWSNGSTNQSTFITNLTDSSLVEVALTDGPFCDTTLRYQVVYDSLPDIIATQTVSLSICHGRDSIILSAPPSNNYYWLPDGSNSSTYILYEPQLHDSVQVLLTSTPTSCPTLTQIEIGNEFFPPEPWYDTLLICPNLSSIPITIDPGFDAFWPASGVTETTDTIPNPAFGDSVIVQLTDLNNGCKTGVTYIFEPLHPNQSPDTTETMRFCDVQPEITLDADPGFTAYLWAQSGASTQIETFNPVALTDTFTVSRFDADGCEYFKHIVFEYQAPPADSIITYEPFCPTTQVLWYHAPGNYGNYQWFVNGESVEGDTAMKQQGAHPGDLIEVMFMDSTGCWNRVQMLPDWNADPAELEKQSIPNAFSPAVVDGVNDQLVFPLGSFDFYTLYIFDRWGKLVHSQESLGGTIAWDGKHNGSLLPGGTYFYRLMVRACGQPEMEEFSGNVLLMNE